MAEDNNKNSKQTEATKNAFVNAAKMHGGPLGAGVNLASKTKLGNAVLNKGAEAFNKQNPVAGRLANALNKGNSDLINNKKNDSKSNPAQAQESSKSSTGAGGGLGSLLNNKSKSKTSGNVSDEQLNGDGEVSGDFAAFVGRILKKHWPKVAAISAGALLFLIIIIAVYLIVASIAGGVIEFFGDIGDALVGFFKPDEQELIEKYYDELDKVQKDLRNRYNVCIDVNLITATLTVDLDAAEYADNIDNPPKEDVSTGEDEGASSEVEETEKDYKKMTKEVGLLGSMQIKRKIYGQDREVMEGDCRSYEEGAKEELVTRENLGRLVFPSWWDNFIKNANLSEEKKIEKYVSENADLVSRHDLNSFQRFFTKKINEEKNYEYYIYSQAYQKECDENGQNCQLVCHKDLVPGNGEDIPTLSIGDLKTMDESVYYWNLVNSFIPNYYERYLPASGEARDKAIKKIAEKIYLLYNDLGPNKVCTDEIIAYNCQYSDSTGSNQSGSSIGDSGMHDIKIQLLQCNDGTRFAPIDGENYVDMEKYIMGVVYAENGGAPFQGLKAQAVAARNYTLTHYDSKETLSDGSTLLKLRNCTERQVYCDPDKGCTYATKINSNGKRVANTAKTVHSGQNGSNDTFYKSPIAQSSKIRQAVNETAGEVLYDASGKILSLGYVSSDQKKWNGMASGGSDYQTILMAHYTGAQSISGNNCVASSIVYGAGTQTGSLAAGNCTNYSDSSPYWNSLNTFNKPQCTWYAYGRALQILVESANLPTDKATTLMSSMFTTGRRDAGQWFRMNAESGVFSASTNINDAKPGAIAVWSNSDPKNPYGHVAVVESVQRDSNGEMVSASFTEGNAKMRDGTVRSCLSSTKNRAKIANPSGTRKFVGYIYLLN